MKPFFCRLALGINLAFGWIMTLFDELFNKHKFVRRFIVFWALLIITWAVHNTFPRLEGEHLLNAFLAILGLLSVVIGFYQWLRNKDGD